MSIETTTSAVSILCDCPYAGKTRVVKESPEKDQERKKKLQQSLKKNKEDLVIARHVLVEARHKLALLQKILSLELGYVVNPHIMTKATWKNRVREENYLKSELLKLVNYLRECDPRYHAVLDVYPTRLSASTEDLLSVVQEKALKQLYHDYTVYHSEIEKLVGSSLWDFFQLKENYENKLYQNKVMEQEISTVKMKIANYQRQFLENKCLIDYVTDHHFKMAGCFSHAFPEKSLPYRDNKGHSLLNSEGLKFKKLWEDSKRQKKMLLNSALALKKHIENVNQRIIRAEDFCFRNIISISIFARKLKGAVILSKFQPKRRNVFGEFSLINYRSQKSQLEAAITENKYLKNFLRKAILSRTEDLRQYQQSLQSTAEKYRKILEAIRSDIMEAEAKQMEATEKKSEKKKKK